MYAISVTAQEFRHAIRRKFEENRYVSDQRVIDVLLLKGRQEYQETINLWKQTDHVMGILLQESKRPQRTFLQKFYEGACIFGGVYVMRSCCRLQGETKTLSCLLLLVCLSRVNLIAFTLLHAPTLGRLASHVSSALIRDALLYSN